MIKGNEKIVRKLWVDRATITAEKDVEDDRGITTTEDITVASDEPCKVIKKTLNSGNQTYFNEVKFNALLLIGNEVEVPKGASILVTDMNGHKQLYKYASGGFEYATHKEVAMLVDDKA